MYQLRRFATSMYRWIKKDATEEPSKKLVGPTINFKKLSKSERKDWLVTQWKAYIKKGSLEDFQRLCADLGLSGDLDTKAKCRKAIRGVNVNIWQFLRSKNKPDDVRFFNNRHRLIRYTKETGSYYPKDRLGKDDPVRDLLRDMDE
ncbi:hypothetical protein CDV36_010072 [Fusarium kuroshium]|uniref:Uncharacterized protein n=2 Tax=Fusarium solani species complex TaxID=232080 RepID=A0A3M2RYD4_9HYPO|nr:hypothetical protein CDV36_010072 [Fusarium kuroshium]RSM16313.1 hypothetical protein CEP52_000136 [Fusarium oligoseptatum]